MTDRYNDTFLSDHLTKQVGQNRNNDTHPQSALPHPTHTRPAPSHPQIVNIDNIKVKPSKAKTVQKCRINILLANI